MSDIPVSYMHDCIFSMREDDPSDWIFWADGNKVVPSEHPDGLDCWMGAYRLDGYAIIPKDEYLRLRGAGVRADG